MVIRSNLQLAYAVNMFLYLLLFLIKSPGGDAANLFH